MISIRGTISESIIQEGLELHTSFVSKEVSKRIDFYINLFEAINSFKKNTKISIIEDKVKQHIHHTQFAPFIRIIFKKEKTFTNKKYCLLKNKSLFKSEFQDVNKVIKQLNQLKKRVKNIIKVDFINFKQNLVLYDNILNELILTPILTKIFDYENWFVKLGSEEDWGPYQLVNRINLKTCCYCNNNYTFSIAENESKVMRPDLDHFLPKEKHPMLALSFFNLIPSCKICNQTLKHDANFNYKDYISPYELNTTHDFFKFDYHPKNYEASIGNSDDLEIRVINNGLIYNQETYIKLEKHKEIFKYEIVYSMHNDVVKEIIKKRFISNDKYIDTLIKTFPGAKLTQEQAYQIAYGNYYDEKDFIKRPLSKLTKDIALLVGIKQKTKKES